MHFCIIANSKFSLIKFKEKANEKCVHGPVAKEKLCRPI